MSVTTQLQIRSLARDPSGHLASQAGAMRRAENVVIRAPGVAESRPNFDLYLERAFTTGFNEMLVKALYEYGSTPLALESIAYYDQWYVRALYNNTRFTTPAGVSIEDASKPIDYDVTESCFAEARKSVYFQTKRGIYKLSSATNTATGMDRAGVEMLVSSDWLAANYNSSSSCVQNFSWAYAWCFVRKDENGYTRRSPPSERFVVTALDAIVPGLATRVYFGKVTLIAGDIVELYRSVRAAGTAPSAELFLTYSHTITSSEVTAGYFVPRYDSGRDDQLGVSLYTNPSQGGALAAKYPPPRAQVLANFASCMWYGRATAKMRAALTTQVIGLGGMCHGNTAQAGFFASFTLGSAVVSVPTTGMTKGADFSDNLRLGSGFSGVNVPALTYILSIDNANQLTMSAVATSGTSVYAGMMSRYSPSGVAVEVAPAGGSHTAGSPIVTAIAAAEVARLRVGMGWSNSASGPAVAGTITKADTRILSIDSATQITLTKDALSTAVGAAGYDCVEIATWPFYAWPDKAAPGAGPWSWPLRCAPYLYDEMNQTPLASFVTNLAAAVNYFAVSTYDPTEARWNQPLFRVRAVVIGDTNNDDRQVTNYPKSIIFEEWHGTGEGMTVFETGPVYTKFYTPFTVKVSRPTAFETGESTITSSNEDRPNRLYWSDPGEPESVPLTNFVDVGSTTEAIVALTPLRNALIVFTTRGVYSVTGSAPNSWVVECLDTTLKLFRPECVTAVGDIAYAWCDRGFFAIDQGGARSISAGALDVELHELIQYVEATTTHGAFVRAWPQRQIVLFGVPGSLTATKTTKVYCYSLVTQAWSEWPVSWGVAAESKEDNFYHSRPLSSIASYEVRSARQSINGYDRLYTPTGNPSLAAAILTIPIADAGQWEPAVGDMVSAVASGFTYYRRITAVNTSGANYLLTLESTIAGSLSTWKAYESARCKIVLEWHPTAPAGIPAGAICRELQVQLDLRLAWSEASKQVSIPQYIVGGTSERDVTPYTLTSNRTRTLQMQPLRVGCSRQIARSAYIAPYFSMIDVFCLRVNGASIVWEGTSERTRR